MPSKTNPTFSRRTTPITLRRAEKTYQAVLAWVSDAEYPRLVKEYKEFLHPHEADSFRSLQFERRKKSYLLGRYAAKQALGHYLGEPDASATLEIVSGIFNHPLVRGDGTDPTGISISHSEHIACALAFPDVHPMALDIEEPNEQKAHVMKTQIISRELEEASAVCENETLRCTIIWTVKEALSKALRCGMTCPYEMLAVKELEFHPPCYVGHFENFGQYKFQAWPLGSSVLSMVLPKKTMMEIDLPFREDDSP